ncbi:transmembrane protein 186 [Oratosquilla oratoria]|uniref:transmembrane protein 186 n=1 Tax=Oratosquilla oratoria TaxID=337810 RepID=UPI003F77567E
MLLRSSCQARKCILLLHCRKPLWPASTSAQVQLSHCQLSSGRDTAVRLKHKENYELIYRFPYIVPARAICRLKIYQTALTISTLPVALLMAYQDILDMSMVFAVGGVSVLAGGMLYIMGELFRRLVGHIYLNHEQDKIKVSHLTFWGRRHDIYMSVNDVVPLVETPDNPTDAFVRFKCYSDPKFTLLLFLRFGGIRDIKSFTHVFGSLNPEQ